MFKSKDALINEILIPLLSFIAGGYMVRKSKLGRTITKAQEKLKENEGDNTKLREEILDIKAKLSNVPFIFKASFSKQPIKKHPLKTIKNNQWKIWSGTVLSGAVIFRMLKIIADKGKITPDTARILRISTGAYLLSSLKEYKSLENKQQLYNYLLTKSIQDNLCLQAERDMYKKAFEGSWFTTFFCTNPLQNDTVNSIKAESEKDYKKCDV